MRPQDARPGCLLAGMVIGIILVALFVLATTEPANPHYRPPPLVTE